MKLIEERRDGALIVKLAENRLDAAIAVDFKDALYKKIDEAACDTVLDLSDVDFMDSSGLGAVVGALKHLGQRGTFSVAGARGAVERVFKLTRMDKVMPLYSSVDARFAANA